MRDGLNRLREIWVHTSRTNQILAAASVLAALVVGIGFVYWASTPDYVPLVTNTSPADSAAIVSHLKEKRVLFRLSADGNTIEVPASQRAELRMTLAGAGLLNSGSLGYELLSKAPFGQTQAMEQQTIKRAMEGEMENSIKSLQPVGSASVKFTAGEDSPFVSEKKEPSASVLVHLKPGQELSKDNIRAIVNLVAHAYPGLTAKNVSVVDGDANVLWDGAQQAANTVGTAERYAQEREFRESLVREFQSMIKTAVGPNKSAVTVRAVLDFDNRREERHEVTAGAPRVKEVIGEKYSGPGTANAARPPVGLAANAGGAPGAPTDPSVYQAPDAGSKGGSYTSERTSTTQDNTIVDTHTIKAPGDVKSLSVAVLLDETVPAKTVEGIKRSIETIARTYLPDSTGQPLVSVETLAFDKTALEMDRKAADAAAASERLNRLLGYGVPLGLMLLMLFILARSLRRPLPKDLLPLPAGAQPALAAASAGGGGLDMRIGDESASDQDTPVGEEGYEAKIVGLPPREDQTHTFELIAENFDANLESIQHLARSKPEVVAMLIKSWMSEDSR